MSYTREEIFSALRAMGPIKASGNDGLFALFFQKYWSVVGDDVSQFFLQVLNEGRDLDSLNATNIVLIPKCDNSNSLAKFRPISLCNVLYKIITKAIMNRFKGVLNLCIDNSQSAFVLGRLISDIVLLAFVLLHTFRQKRIVKKGFFGS